MIQPNRTWTEDQPSRVLTPLLYTRAYQADEFTIYISLHSIVRRKILLPSSSYYTSFARVCCAYYTVAGQSRSNGPMNWIIIKSYSKDGVGRQCLATG